MVDEEASVEAVRISDPFGNYGWQLVWGRRAAKSTLQGCRRDDDWENLQA
jgi:hypothetical protein